MLPRVTLQGDPEFEGYLVGRIVDAAGQDTGQALVSISKSGRTGLRGGKPLPFDQLVIHGRPFRSGTRPALGS